MSLPLEMERKKWEAGRLLDSNRALSLTLQCPALFLQSLPNDWNSVSGRGLITGDIAWSGKVAAPSISGEAQLLDLSFSMPLSWPQITWLGAEVRFFNTEAVLDPLRCEVDSIPIELRGSLSTSLTGFELTLSPRESGIEVLSQPGEGSSLSTVQVLGEGRSEGQPLLREVLVRGTVFPLCLSLTTAIQPSAGENSAPSQRTYFPQLNDFGVSSLLLRIVAPQPAPGFELDGEKSHTNSP
jgi:hypothetical protein